MTVFDGWRLHDFAPGDGVRAGTNTEAFDDGTWLPIEVPGDVHRALLAAGRIDDHYYDRNESACAWMEEREWWYRVRFDGPTEPLASDERLRLVFHGLDTFATVWLNGSELGRHANKFRPATFDVSGALRSGEPNVLAICFDRPLDHVPPEQVSAWGRNPERAAMRKAQFGFGWDWGPSPSGRPTASARRPTSTSQSAQPATGSRPTDTFSRRSRIFGERPGHRR